VTTNKYFRPFNYTREQDVADDLIVESIKIYGQDVKYMPRTVVDEDILLGEDRLSTYDQAIDIEMYIKNTQGFEGEGDFLSKFDLQIRDQITFTVARKRWNQIRTEKLIDEVGFNYQMETANTGVYANSDGIMLETATANGYAVTSSRPLEGDVIFFPLTSKLYEIKFVEHEAIFYQHGKLYTYDLTCELFDRIGAKRLNTGNTAIDAIELRYTQDILLYQVTLEDGGGVLNNEDDGFILQEYRIESTVITANNEFFTQEASTIIDFSNQNPFSEVDRY
jgi:hypothetical protein